MTIDINQYSTKSGAIKIIFAALGFLGWWLGKDISVLLPFYLALGGAQGVASRE